MRQLRRVSLPLILLIALAGRLPSAAKNEYFTENELDLIRDAQELSMRVPTYFKLAERRLIFLGLMEKSKEQIEKERKEREKREKEAKKPTNDTRATADKVGSVEDTAYLDTFTPAELIRGYIQAIDEVTTNIDDAYSRKLDVRDPLEDLAKFIKETSPLLEKFKPKNASERAAIQDAIDKAKQTAADTKEALSIVPKTEKKRKP